VVAVVFQVTLQSASLVARKDLMAKENQSAPEGADRLSVTITPLPSQQDASP
jgi:hypothetical protein